MSNHPLIQFATQPQLKTARGDHDFKVGEGVERTFPVHSPNIEKIEVERVSQVMRARLFYLRDRQGKSATKVKEKRFDPTEHAAAAAAAAK